MSEKPQFLRKPDGRVFPYSDALMARGDMVPFDPATAQKRYNDTMKKLKKLGYLVESTTKDPDTGKETTLTGGIDTKKVAAAKTALALISSLDAIGVELKYLEDQEKRAAKEKEEGN